MVFNLKGNFKSLTGSDQVCKKLRSWSRMSKATIYGIKNCNTMKKTFDWMSDNGEAYDFHDYKKSGAVENVIRIAIDAHGWEKVINRAGMTWRKLPDDVKNNMDLEGAVALALDKPSVIKRPMLVIGDESYLGFSEKQYAEIFKK